MRAWIDRLMAIPWVGHSWAVVKRVVVGTYTDGFTQAGNLAYLSLIALFPFFIVATAVASALGRTSEGLHTIDVLLDAMPDGVAATLKGPITEVLNARNGVMLWIGGLFGLWTVGSFIEALREILRRAYGTVANRSFWHYRLTSAGMIVASVLLLFLSFSLQVITVTAENVMTRFLPSDIAGVGEIALTRGISLFGMFIAVYLLFVSLTPMAYRGRANPKWPGALATTLWAQGVTVVIPIIVASLVSYDLTYGSLAGVMIVLFFFYLIGLGIVIGAELNAALARGPTAPWRLGGDVPGKRPVQQFEEQMEEQA